MVYENESTLKKRNEEREQEGWQRWRLKRRRKEEEEKR